MMRYVFFTLLGFFGPALLMLFLRLLWSQLHTRWLKKKGDVEIIDVTPLTDHPTANKRFSPWFIAVWLALSISCTAFLIWQMDHKPEAQNTVYIPAHINATGQFVPASQQPQREESPD